MKVPLSWLKDFVDINMSVPELADLMTMAGLEVTHIDYIGLPESDLPWDRDMLVLGHVIRVEQHPDADRLVLATADIGTDEPETVVTGAPNLFPYIGKGDISALGLKSPFVMEGATVYDGHAKEPGKKMKLKGRAIRGIMNRHMLCSEKELGISDEHDGIMLMQSDAAAGTPLVDVLGDAVLEFDVLPNISRTTSIIGVAREIAALTGQKVRYPDYSLTVDGDANLTDHLSIETTDPELNPRFIGVLLEDIEIKESPYWMQLRLRLAGMRPISNIVDVSNYVMLEVGQPNHAFDWDVLKGRAAEYSDDGKVRIITRLAEDGETLLTLDDEVRKMPTSAMMVTDPKSALSVAGVMGGASSEVSDTSKNILIEAAAWNFINIRQTATALKLHSEAGYRFSRGVHPSLAKLGALRAAKLIQDVAGGKLRTNMVDNYPLPPKAITLEFSTADVTRLLGVNLSRDKIRGYLEGLEFVCEATGDETLHVTVPNHRLDISDDPIIGRADLVEEVARMYGFDKIPSTEMGDTLPPQRNNVALDRENALKDLLVQAGLQEIITYRLTTPEAEARVSPEGTVLPDGDYVALVNPSSADRRVMRRSLLNSVLEIATDNSRFTDEIRLFEVATVFLPTDDILPLEQNRAALVLTGARAPHSWQDGDAAPMDFFDLKGVLEAVLAGLHIADVRYQKATHPTYYPGRTAEILAGDTVVGVMGELHPKVSAAYNLPETAPILAADLDLDALFAKVSESYRVAPIPKFPAVQQDIAVVVDEAVPAEAIDAVIRKTGGFLLADMRLFDIYRGKQIGAGKKSMAYNLWFQSPDKTLNDKVVAKQQKRIVQALEKQLGAKLRA